MIREQETLQLPTRIDALVRAHAQTRPDAPALREDGRTLSYRELAGEIDACAAWLREMGVQAGERVMLVSENCAAQVAALFAISSLDAWFVNVNARLTAPELDAIRTHCGARVVLYTAAASPDAAAHAARSGASASAGAGAHAHGELMASLHADGVVPEAVVPEPMAAEPIAALVYTTGTTGRPKGVMLSHRNLLFVASVSSRLRGVVPGDLAYGVLPVSHVYGLTSVLLGTLAAGACLRLAPRFTPQAMLAAIRDEGLSIVQGVPAMYARLLELCRAEGVASPLASNLRFAYAGGSPLDPTLKAEVEHLLGVALHNGYGLTEAAPTVSQTRLDAPRADTSVGHAIPGVEVRIDAAGGEPGKLWVRGPNVMHGYYRDPAGTAAVLGPDGWLDTGDLARRDADGALFIAGRSKELIIRSGFKVYPLEVETVLNAHPAVTQSAVVGRSLPDGNEEVVAFVQPAAHSMLTSTELGDWASARLAPYKRPARIVFMDSLPAAANGKVLKHRLKT